MAHPFEVTPEEIDSLDEHRLQELVNRLVEIEVSQEGLSADVLVASDRLHDKDGGIDARIRASGFNGNEFLPPNSSIWQAKAGKSRWPDYDVELGKERVRDAVQNGYTYVVVLGRQVNAEQYDDQEAKLIAALREITPNPSFKIRSASQIAKWATKYPALWHLLGRPPSPSWGVRDFLAQHELHGVDYCWSDSTKSLRDAMRTQIEDAASGRALRIHGRTGVGKTRVVLETFAEPSSTAVYVPFADVLSVEVLTWLRDRPDLSVTVIVDECTLSEAERIQSYLSSAKGDLRLVTIGTDPPPDRLNHLEVAPMTDDVTRQVVSRVHPNITVEQREWIVDKARGFVKLARSLAEMARRSGIDLTQVNVPCLLGAMFTAEQRKAMTVVALLSHLGWDGELEAEGRMLSDHIGIDWADCRRVIRDLERRGYIGRTGRYRYATPELLAIWFAAEEWSANRTRLLEMFAQVSPETADRMSNRLRQMPHVDEVADIAKEVLGPDGPFRSLAVLNQPRNARLFSDFARIAPDSAIATLEAVFDRLDAAELRTLVGGRREIVWALERLVARQNLFPSAARLLLRLALAENEHFANNATGVFHSLFKPTGRATAANGDERLRVLGDVADSTEEQELQIAIGAFKGIFNVHGGHAISADPGGEPPPPAWVPQSWEERASYCRQALVLLEHLLGHQSAPVRVAAETALWEQFRSLFWLGLGDEALKLANRADLSESLRRRLAVQSDDVLTYDHDKAFMTDDLMARLRALRPTIFADPLRERLHHRLGSWNRDLYRAARDGSENPLEVEAREIEQLAADLIQHSDILRDEFEWITSEEAVKGRQFLTYLAKQDGQRQWLDAALEASLMRNRPELIASYALGLSLSAIDHDVDDMLERWSEDGELRHLVPPVTATLGLTERGIARLLTLLDHGLNPATLFCLEYARCEADVTPVTLATLLRAMAAAGPPLTGTVWSILNHLQRADTRVTWTSDQSFEDLSWELVGNPQLIGDSGDAHASYSWAECAKPLVRRDPQRLAAAIVEAVQLGNEHLYAGSYVRDVLEGCFLANPFGVWAAFAEAVEGVSIESWILTSWAAEQGITEKIGIDSLRRWAHEDVAELERRIVLVAKLTTVDTELTPLIRWLVEDHGDSEEIMSELDLEQGTRFSYGGLVDMEQPRLAAAREWTNDAHAGVRTWARRRVDELEWNVRRYRVMDEESELRR